MKKNLLLIILILGLGGCLSPSKVVESYSTDNNGKTVKTVTKFYDNNQNNRIITQPNVTLYSSPFWYDSYFYRGYNFTPRIIVPVRPRVGGRGHH